ncbi:MAG: hypothetical protein Q8L60_12875 [Gammaproteobacteria bacterium]|nr:hypothetical protein [Gammaproteobacteria bacterium]MDP2139465.1 hypothetical protein [Gammaproteobacteria bacterium]MDP2346301.1 hypothetical protein [Gammaproteobacteria bacterium]
MKSSIIALLASLTLLASSSVIAQTDARLKTWLSLQDTDSKFSERSRTLGVNTAVLGAIGESAVVFRRGPVDARTTYERISPEQAQRATLESRANYIEFSLAGDLGLTAGPYRHTVGAGEEQRRTYGHFITIYRQFDGEWRLMADMVVRVPGVLSLNVNPQISETEKAIAESAPVDVAAQNTLESLVAAEELFVRAINFRGGRRAILRYGLDTQRVYVPGMAPGIGSESGSMAYGAFLDEHMDMSLLTHQPGGAYMAQSGDVGYTYGTMLSEGSDFTTNYLRFWRFTAAGEWKIAVEVLNPF